VARVELSAATAEDLHAVIASHELPDDTPARVARSLRPLERCPDVGVALTGRWSGMRFLHGPWRWMLLISLVLDERVVTIQGARAAAAPTPER